MSEKIDLKVVGALSIAVGIVASLMLRQRGDKKAEPVQNETTEKPIRYEVAVLGDVGATNIRLKLMRMNMTARESQEIKPFKIYPSQKVSSFQEALEDFLSEFKGSSDWPTIGVVGIAGEVNKNTVKTTNCPHWPVADGNAIAAELGFKQFTFINDFTAAGYGVCQLKKSDSIKLDNNAPEEHGVKVVMGPGTGLGVGYLTKSTHSKYHEVFASEGGHTDFSVVNEEDWELHKFVRWFVPNSNNVENRRHDKKNSEIARVSVERLCAGPAVPLLYEFYKQRPEFKNHPLVLEKAVHADELTAKDIIKRGMNYEENQDELCYKVIQKFAEILAVEIGNQCIYYLPSGGLYLVGGVTHGIMEYIQHGQTNQKFLDTIYAKGRLEPAVRRIPIYVVKPDVELGILGTEEFAFR